MKAVKRLNRRGKLPNAEQAGGDRKISAVDQKEPQQNDARHRGKFSEVERTVPMLRGTKQREQAAAPLLCQKKQRRCADEKQEEQIGQTPATERFRHAGEGRHNRQAVQPPVDFFCFLHGTDGKAAFVSEHSGLNTKISFRLYAVQICGILDAVPV